MEECVNKRNTIGAPESKEAMNKIIEINEAYLKDLNK